MELPSEVVRHVLKQGLPESEAMSRLERYSEQRRKSHERSQKIERMQADHAAKIKKMLAEELCTHEVVKYHGDPSGGSDSDEQCLICGAYVGRG